MAKRKSKANGAATTLTLVPKTALPAQPKEKKPAKYRPPMHMYCRCLIDPESAPACRMPDSYVAPTSAVKVVEEFVLSTNADGDAALYIYPATVASRKAVVVAGGAVSTLTNVAAADHTELAAAADYGRVVVYSVSVQYIGPANLASGRIVLVPETSTTYLVVGSVLSGMLDDGVPQKAQDGAFVTVRPKVEQPFVGLGSFNNFLPQMDLVYGFATGLPINSPCLSVRITRHMELLPKRNSLWRGTAVSELHNPEAMTQAANLGTVGASGSVANKSWLVSTAEKAAGYAWEYAQPAITNAAWNAVTQAGEQLLLMM